MHGTNLLLGLVKLRLGCRGIMVDLGRACRIGSPYVANCRKGAARPAVHHHPRLAKRQRTGQITVDLKELPRVHDRQPAAQICDLGPL